MERAAERMPSDDREPASDDALIVPVSARGEPADEDPSAPIGTPVTTGDETGPAPIGTPVESVVDVPIGQAIAKRPAPAAAPPWTRVEPAPRVEPGRTDGLTEDGALPPRPRPSYTAHLLAAALVLLACVLGAWGLAVRDQRAREKRAFLALLERVPAEGLRRADGLAGWLGEDPDVQAALGRARERLAAEAARDEARRLLARADAAETLEERLELCDQAARADPSWATPRAALAEALLLVHRRDVAVSLARDARAVVPVDVAAAALRQLDAAARLVTSRDVGALGELELLRARLCLAAPGEPVARRRAASAALEQALRAAERESAVWLLAEASARALARDWARVFVHADGALQRDPSLVAGYVLRSEANLRRGEAAAAAADAREALALDPRCVDALALEVEARFFAGRAPTSSVRALELEGLDRALRWDPGHPRALAARAYARLVRDRAGLLRSTPAERQAARADAGLALRLDPGQALAHAVLAELAFAEGATGPALDAAQRAVAADPELPDLHLLRGRLRARAGDRGALEDFEAVLRLRAADARALTNRAALLLATGDAAAAYRAADRAVVYDATLPEAYFQRARAALAASPRRAQAAVDDLSRALSLDAGLADAWLYRACALFDARMFGPALQDLERAEVARLERGAFHARDLFLVRGHCLFKLRRWGEAVAAYGEYLRLAGGRPAPPALARRLARARDVLAGGVEEAAVDTAVE